MLNELRCFLKKADFDFGGIFDAVESTVRDYASTIESDFREDPIGYYHQNPQMQELLRSSVEKEINEWFKFKGFPSFAGDVFGKIVPWGLEASDVVLTGRDNLGKNMESYKTESDAQGGGDSAALGTIWENTHMYQ